MPRPGVLYGRDGRPGSRGFVASELHDDHVRWMDTTEKTYRGQTLQVWSVMNANNYRYVILYAFRDDGVINVRLGATANNRYSTPADWATHIHCGFWRVNIDLGDPFANALAVVRFNPSDAHTTVEPVVTEKRIKWNPEEYTRLRLTSTRFQNGHAPANYIGYDLVLHTEGSGRHKLEGEEFTHHDFWVTRARPLDLRPRDLPAYERGQMLEENRPVLWVQASVLHTSPTKTSAGTDTTAWAEWPSPPGTGSTSSPGTSSRAPPCTTARRTDPAPAHTATTTEASPVRPRTRSTITGDVAPSAPRSPMRPSRSHTKVCPGPARSWLSRAFHRWVHADG